MLYFLCLFRTENEEKNWHRLTRGQTAAHPSLFHLEFTTTFSFFDPFHKRKLSMLFVVAMTSCVCLDENLNFAQGTFGQLANRDFALDYLRKCNEIFKRSSRDK